MAVEVFHGPKGSEDERRFSVWKDRYRDDGLYLTFKSARRAALHRAWCSCLDYKETTPVCLTTHKKACSLFRRELEDWAVAQDVAMVVPPCRRCSPKD